MNRKVFDLVLVTVLLSKPAFGLVKMAARRWVREESGPLATAGQAVVVAL
jgi:hypothetical protein